MKIPKIKSNWKARTAIVISLGLLVFLPTHFSNACVPWDVACMAREGASWIFISLRFLFGSIIAGLMALLNYAVYARAYNNVPVVVSMWEILRDLSNMFFILALIYMAFATIFQIGKYRFQDMIWRFLIVAVLINFSLVLGGLVIDGTQVLTNVFLNMIGNPGDKIGQFLDPSLLLKGAADPGDALGPGFVGLVFDVILSGMFMFSLLVAVVFTLFRTLAIWGLLIVAPIAWMAHILPGTQKWFSKWWGWFFGWNLFLPVYLFILYLGLVFLSQGKQVIQKVTGAGDTTLFGTGNITINLIFFYGFATLFMAYGTMMATKMTTAFGGEGFQKGVDWATTAVKRAPIFSSYFAAQKAAGARFEQFQKEGLKNKYLGKIYGGEAGQKRLEAAWADRLRIGSREAREKQVSSDVSNFKSRYERLDTNQLRTLMSKGTNVYSKLAARDILKERNQLTNEEQVETYAMYNKLDPKAGLKYANSIDYGKLSPPEREEWLGRTRNIELLKKISNAMAERGDYSNSAQVLGAATLFTSAADRAAFLRKAAKRLDPTEVADVLSGVTSRDEQVAISEVLADKQELDGDEILQAYVDLGPGSEDAEKFIGKVRFDSLNKIDRDSLFAAAQVGTFADVEIQHKLYESILGKDDEFDAARLRHILDTYRTKDEKKEILKKAEKKHFIAAAEVRFAVDLGGDITRPGAAPRPVTNVTETIQALVDKMKVEDLADLPAGTKGWGDARLKAAVADRMTFIQDQQPPQPPRLMNPALPFDANTNPIISPAKPGAGAKLKADLLETIKGNRRKVGDINSLPPLP